jgi:DNA repair protein RecO (recombination protein O)
MMISGAMISRRNHGGADDSGLVRGFGAGTPQRLSARPAIGPGHANPRGTGGLPGGRQCGVPLYRDEAVVLRTQKLGEADRIITILSRSMGQIRCVGKGVRRTSSRFGSRLEPFTHVDIQLYSGRSLDVVNQVETIHSYGAALVSDYPAYTAGTAMLETAERLTSEEREPAVQQYLLLVGGLRALEERVHQPRLVLDSYLLRSLSVAGWAPSFSDCARCGTPGPHSAFHISSGGSVCPACRPAGSLSPAPEVVALLAALLSGDWETADAVDVRFLDPAAGIVAAFLQWHLERGLRSLRLVDRTMGG